MRLAGAAGTSALAIALVALITTAQADSSLHYRLCASGPCGGTFARLELFNDAEGRLARIRMRGDFRVCSHPPTVYYDAQGRALESIDDWLRTGAQKADADAAHARITAGLRRANDIACADVCKPTHDPGSTACLPP